MTPPNGQNILNPIFGTSQVITLNVEEIRRDEMVTVQFVMECLLQGIFLSGNYYIVQEKAEVMKKLMDLGKGK